MQKRVPIGRVEQIAKERAPVVVTVRAKRLVPSGGWIFSIRFEPRFPNGGEIGAPRTYEIAPRRLVHREIEITLGNDLKRVLGGDP